MEFSYNQIRIFVIIYSRSIIQILFRELYHCVFHLKPILEIDRALCYLRVVCQPHYYTVTEVHSIGGDSG